MSDAWGWSPVGDYKASGTPGIAGSVRPIGMITKDCNWLSPREDFAQGFWLKDGKEHRAPL